MKSFSRPVLFSSYFNLPPEILREHRFIDPFLNVDTPLFIDPVLLDKSANDVIRNEAYDTFKTRFETVLRLLKISAREGDAAWKGAQRQLPLDEALSNGLGYGSGERNGTRRSDEIRDAILRTSKEILALGAEDPEMISLMAFFEEDVGPDTISDLTTSYIEPQLAKITQQFCAEYNIDVKTSKSSPVHALPHYKYANGRERGIVLVPLDILQDLPIANDWSDVERAASANDAIRRRVSEFLSAIAKPTVTDRKAAIRSAALQSAELFNAFVAALKDGAESYDPNSDALGYFTFRQLLMKMPDKMKGQGPFNVSSGIEEMERVVKGTIDMFRHHVEDGNLWEMLWGDGKPKRERASQLLYFAIADSFCIANNIDISPEAHMGGGPVDFKFSKGYEARIVVEIKRSSGQVVHGYEKQLEVYKAASRTEYGIFIVIDYGDGDEKIKTILEIQRQRRAAKENASEIVIIDASQKASASKR
ncbi:hypothetical protein [Asticcacaulis endophyticus]|uniref:Uncharacterized protein n=1 Tax=Asticcacaulis endophyticus TaxID=1395890 RepID=A0A918Q3N6_9CAUL|nr:hypothetical protein [Asticcacaulis endophyticus]GGZ30640.1 hypothetical protein GCM10011273_16320 [Asticcacaulis endophyticus]